MDSFQTDAPSANRRRLVGAFTRHVRVRQLRRREASCQEWRSPPIKHCQAHGGTESASACACARECARCRMRSSFPCGGSVRAWRLFSFPGCHPGPQAQPRGGRISAATTVKEVRKQQVGRRLRMHVPGGTFGGAGEKDMCRRERSPCRAWVVEPALSLRPGLCVQQACCTEVQQRASNVSMKMMYVAEGWMGLLLKKGAKPQLETRTQYSVNVGPPCICVHVGLESHACTQHQAC